MKKIRIAHIVEDMGVGGLETVVASIVTGLSSASYEIEVWCLSRGGEIADELKAQGVPVRVIGLNNYYNPFNIAALARRLTQHHIQIIHTHGYYASTFGRMAAIIACIPVCFAHFHTTGFHLNRRNHWIDRFLAFFSRKIICVSNTVSEFVVQTEKISPGRVETVYNGASCHEAAPSNDDRLKTRRRWKIGPDDLVFCSVATLKQNKGHFVLLDAFKSLSELRPDCRLLLIGDGPLRDRLTTYAKNLMISERVIFAGSRRDVQAILLASDVAVLASLFKEGLGLSLIEAMCVRLPLIATRIGGIPEVVLHGVNGLLVAPGDRGQLFEALTRLADDTPLRRRMGESGRSIYLKQFTKEHMLARIEHLYRQSIVGSPRLIYRLWRAAG